MASNLHLQALRGGGVAFLSRDWKTRIGEDDLKASTTSIIFTRNVGQISGLANSLSVGTNDALSTDAYVAADGVFDVTAYWGSDKSKIVIYSAGTIYAPRSCSRMFIAFAKLTTISFQNFITNKVTDMNYMFCATAFESLDLSGFNTANVASMGGMFERCSNIADVDLSSFVTSNLESIWWMFAHCSKLKSLNIGNFNLQKCSSGDRMLLYCSSLSTFILPYNLPSGITIDLPASNYYNGSAGPYSTVGTATSGTTVACSTASSKVTLTKR